MFQDNNPNSAPQSPSFEPQQNSYGPAGYPQEPTPVQPQQPAGGSYYSPRSSYPAQGYGVPPQMPPQDGFRKQEVVRPPRKSQKKKSTKVLKGIAVFAGIALLSYGSIAIYKLATKDDSIRSFLDSAAEESSSAETEQSSSAAQTTDAGKTDNNTVNTNWIELAARKDALSIPDIVDKVTPATVGVASNFTYRGQSYSFWGFGQPQNYEQEVSATGTGIIMSKNPDGSYYIITNAHVIYDNDSRYQMGEAKSVSVVLNDKYYSGDTQLDAKIVDYDVAEDIAVLKVETKQELTIAEFGDSDQLRVGELVIAIGNPLGFELFGSVTTGIVSALNREVTINDNTMNLIQTDTAINAGNSGGPLINSYGQVIGINSSKISSNYADGSASVEGLCFAIPISHAREVINDLINHGYVTGKPLLGITGKNVDEQTSQAYGLPVGVYVKAIEKGGAADTAGIKVGDVIIAVDDQTVTTYDELSKEKDKHKAGDTITLTIVRFGQDMKIDLVLQEKRPVFNE